MLELDIKGLLLLRWQNFATLGFMRSNFEFHSANLFLLSDVVSDLVEKLSQSVLKILTLHKMLKLGYTIKTAKSIAFKKFQKQVFCRIQIGIFRSIVTKIARVGILSKSWDLVGHFFEGSPLALA